MSFWSAVVAIVAILAFTAMRISAFRAGIDPHAHRRDRLRGRDRGPALPSPREEELSREVEELHQRIAVLERIATDANSSSSARVKAISDEIEALRDR
jgi:hypothetical protein